MTHRKTAEETDWQKWLQSKEGKSCMQPDTFQTQRELQYLENRLWWAFTAGQGNVLESYASQPEGREETKFKYLLERTDTQEWFVMNFEPYVHSYLHGELGPGPDRWTKDANEAHQWLDKSEAEAYRNKNFNSPNYKITEHEFVSQPSTDKNK